MSEPDRDVLKFLSNELRDEAIGEMPDEEREEVEEKNRNDRQGDSEFFPVENQEKDGEDERKFETGK